MRVTTFVRKLLAQLPLESTAEAILLHGLRMQLRCSLLKVRYTAQRGISPDTACASHQPAAFCMLPSQVLVLIIAFVLILRNARANLRYADIVSHYNLYGKEVNHELNLDRLTRGKGKGGSSERFGFSGKQFNGTAISGTNY